MADARSVTSRAPGYDRLPERWWLFVPLWGIVTWFRYAPRRVQCPQHGVVVEQVPWSEGKRPVTRAMMCFLSRLGAAAVLAGNGLGLWHQLGMRLSVGGVVCPAGAWPTANSEGIESIGVDEIHWGQSQRADNFLTVIYQIDAGCRRLLWVGKRRTKATLRRGLAALGEPVVTGLRFVCTDMWRPYLTVIAAKAGQALHVLDRFHITAHLNQAVDEVRRAESGRLRGRPLAEKLKKMRWKLLRKGSRVRGRARRRLCGLLQSKLATGRAWMLKETFQDFWRYRSLTWAGGFLDVWTTRALRSRLEPMKKVARMLRSHQPLLMNWFKAKGEISAGAVEGLNNKIRVVTRRSYGFRTYDAMEIALYHTLGRLPEPNEFTHTIC